MNKTELVASIAEKAGISKKDADKALAAFIDTVAAELKAGGSVQLMGFGTFKVAERAARTGVMSSLEGGQVYWGAPAAPYKDAAKQYAAIRKLPEAMKEMVALKKQATEIKELIDQALAEQAGN